MTTGVGMAGVGMAYAFSSPLLTRTEGPLLGTLPPIMKTCTKLLFLALVLSLLVGPRSVAAQVSVLHERVALAPLLERAAERAAELQQGRRPVRRPVDRRDPAPPRTRSFWRTITGVGMAGVGMAYAFSNPQCRVVGELGTEPALSIEVADFTDLGLLAEWYVVFENPRLPIVERRDDVCVLDWTVDMFRGVRLGSALTDTSELDPADVSLAIGLERLGSYSASAKLSDFGVVEETRGSAQAVTRWSSHRLATGISVAAAGVLLATIWSKVPAGIDVDVAPGGARFSKSFSF